LAPLRLPASEWPAVVGEAWEESYKEREAQMQIPKTSNLRLLDEGDAAELHALIDANRAYLARWLPWAEEQTPDDTMSFIRKTREQLAGNDGFQAAVISGEGIVGVIGYHGVSWANRSTSIGYWLAEEQQGRGTMTAAVRTLVDHALSTWRLNRVEIRAAVENRRSRAIPERLGFRQEGMLRDVERVGDRYLDCVLYSMLAADWRVGKGKGLSGGGQGNTSRAWIARWSLPGKSSTP
jgi:ribosomal-protein-serine acetyltransferase